MKQIIWMFAAGILIGLWLLVIGWTLELTDKGSECLCQCECHCAWTDIYYGDSVPVEHGYSEWVDGVRMPEEENPDEENEPD